MFDTRPLATLSRRGRRAALTLAALLVALPAFTTDFTVDDFGDGSDANLNDNQ